MKRIDFTDAMDRALLFAWDGGESMHAVSRRFKVGRSTLYRRAAELGLKRDPLKCRPRPYLCLPWVPDRAHPLVKQLFAHMREQRIPLGRVAHEVGISREAVGSWRLSSSPMLVNFEAALNVVGYELVIRQSDLE